MKAKEALRLVWQAPEAQCKLALALIVQHIYYQGEIDQDTTDDILDILKPEEEVKEK